MQAKDIPDEAFLAAVTATEQVEPAGPTWRELWNVHETLNRQLGIEIPGKVFRAKARRLILSKKLHGCPCSGRGCRGDYHLPGQGFCC